MNLNNKFYENRVWSDECLVGIEIIDNQHKNFFRMLDELVSLNSKEDKEEEILQIINKFEQYTIYHFSTEEGFMDKNNYPDIERHKNLHKLYAKKIMFFKNEYTNGNHAILEEMTDYARRWLLYHILYLDVHATFDRSLITE